MAKEVIPTYNEIAFNCPRCGVLAPQKWYAINRNPTGKLKITINELNNNDQARVDFFYPHERKLEWKLDISLCDHCNNYSIWENKNMIYPFETELPEPHEDMFEDVKGIYSEATLVYKHSPRTSAALLRLAIETMIPQLEDYNIKKDNLNVMIGELVEKKIPEHIQQGLDFIRYYGNNGIHPGEINLNEETETVLYLFNLVSINHLLQNVHLSFSFTLSINRKRRETPI